MSRKRLSGDQYRKNAKIKSDNLQNVLNQTHKLTDFFGSKASSTSCSSSRHLVTSSTKSSSNNNTMDINVKKTDAQVSDTETKISLS